MKKWSLPALVIYRAFCWDVAQGCMNRALFYICEDFCSLIQSFKFSNFIYGSRLEKTL